MEAKDGVQINRNAIIQLVAILFVLIIAAGILTHELPPGQYDRLIEDRRGVISTDSFELINAPDYPVWLWFTTPLEVPFTPDGLIVVMIIPFILWLGGLRGP